MIEPIGKHQQQQVRSLSHEYLRRAESHYRLAQMDLPILFDLKGSCAGMFRVQKSECQIRYNPWLFAKYPQENLDNTVPHEVAHFIVYRRFGWGKVRPHGEEWRQVMALFGADPLVTGHYDLSGIPQRRQRRFQYRCPCQQHALSTRRHNSIQSGRTRLVCLACAGDLDYLGD